MRVGLVEVRVDDDALAFRAPPLLRGGPLTAAERAEAIRVAGGRGRGGRGDPRLQRPGWRLLRLESAGRCSRHGQSPKRRCRRRGPDRSRLPGAGADFEVRAFFSNPQGKIVEDPVTGSLNAAAAQVIFAPGLAKGRYVAAQGRCTGADGRVELTKTLMARYGWPAACGW
jgi:hypothetical protein